MRFNECYGSGGSTILVYIACAIAIVVFFACSLHFCIALPGHFSCWLLSPEVLHMASSMSPSTSSCGKKVESMPASSSDLHSPPRAAAKAVPVHTVDLEETPDWSPPPSLGKTELKDCNIEDVKIVPGSWPRASPPATEEASPGQQQKLTKEDAKEEKRTKTDEASSESARRSRSPSGSESTATARRKKKREKERRRRKRMRQEAREEKD